MQTCTSLLSAVAGVGLWLLGSTCWAQRPARQLPFGRYYVEVHLNRADYELLGFKDLGVGGTSPWMVAVGRQLSPRWAAQLNYAYAHDGFYQNPSYTGTTTTGQIRYGWRSSDVWAHTATALVRYRLYQSASSRLRLEAFGGGAGLSSRFEIAGEGFVAGVSTGVERREGATRQVYLTAGLGACFSVTKHLEGVVDYGYIRNLKEAPDYVHLNTVGNKWGLTRTMSLGLRYRFNLPRRPVPAAAVAP